MKKITIEFLNNKNACEASLDWAIKNGYLDKPIMLGEAINILIEKDRLSDANWLITRCMNKKQNVMYAISASEQVIDIYENKYPNDNRPRKAIEAAKTYLKNPCKKTKDAADADADAAYAADADAAYAADADAAYAAYAAASAAAAAYADAAYAYAAAAAAYAADAYAADADAAAARKELRIKILNCGLDIIKNKR